MTDTLVYLVRHAKAGSRGCWAGPDDLRPLTPDGWRQAERLVQRWVDQPLAHLVSSPFLRCVQTLEPLAAARGLPIEERDELGEGMPWEYTEKLVLEAAAEGTAALSVHGDAMQLLV